MKAERKKNAELSDYEGMDLREMEYGELVDHYGKRRRYALDLIAPTGKEGPFPVVMFIHGGGFSLPCTKRQRYIPVFARIFTSQGWAVAAPEYPVFDTYPEAAAAGERAGAVKAAEAIKTAYSFLASNSGDLRIDMGKCALIGGSAGGWASFYALSMYPGLFKAFINLWGPPETVPDVSSFPPTVSVHGTSDKLVPYSREKAVQDALEEKGIKHTLVTLEGLGHTPVDEREQYLPEVMKCLSAVLG